jgi:integrase
LFAALPAGFQVQVVEFAAGPFARLTYAYPSRPPARLDLGVLPEPMRQEVAYWLHTLAVAGERVNSWALAGWVRIAAAVAARQELCSFTGLSVDEWMAAARRRYHDRHRRLPPESYLHNHRATITRLHGALMLACQAGHPWWRSQVWDPRHDRRIPVREHEPLEGQRLNFARVGPAWLREAIQWYFAAGLTTGLLSWSSLPGYLSYLGRHFAGFLAAEGIDTPVLAADTGTGLRPVALRLLAYLRQQTSRAGRPLAPSTIGLVQTTVAGFYAFMADRRAEAARELAEPRWAGLSDAHARWWRPGEIAGSGRYRGQAEGNYIDAAAMSRIAGHADILGLPRDQAKPVTVGGTACQVRGLGDEQAMRAFLLAIATGRRINEILMMDFAPLSAIPGLDAGQAAEPGGPAARLRYQQTKIAGAPQAILVGADVAAIVNEQQEFARALVRARDPAAGDPPYLFLAWQANTAGQRHYRANTLNGLLTQLAAALQITDAAGAPVDFQRTHRMRHTKATDLLNAGVPIHVVAVAL